GHAVAVEGPGVEGLGGHQGGRDLAGIERGAGRIAIDVDDAARQRGVHRGRTEIGSEGVELVDVPVGVVTRELLRDEAVLAVVGNVEPGMGERYEERRSATVDGEPGFGHAVFFRKWGVGGAAPLPPPPASGGGDAQCMSVRLRSFSCPFQRGKDLSARRSDDRAGYDQLRRRGDIRGEITVLGQRRYTGPKRL